MERTFMLLASINGFVAVALGAFGAHGLKGMMASLDDGAQRLAWWETASRYHLAHALALGLVAVLGARLPGVPAVQFSGWAMQAGVVLFSGSLYAMTLSGVRVLGAVTPLGGLCLLAGWAALGVAALKL